MLVCFEREEGLSGYGEGFIYLKRREGESREEKRALVWNFPVVDKPTPQAPKPSIAHLINNYP